MRSTQFRLSVLAVAMALMIGASGCGTSADRSADAVENYFAAWNQAWSGADPYSVIRFYDGSVEVFAQTDRDLGLTAGFNGSAHSGKGRLRFASWLSGQTRHDREIEQIFLFSDGAAVLYTIDERVTASVTLMKLSGSQITEQSMFRWRSARPPGAPVDARLAWVDELVGDYLAAWSGAETVKLASLSVGSRVADAVFVLSRPGSQRVALVVEIGADDCRSSTIIVLELEDRLIKRESRAQSLDTVRLCTPEFFDTNPHWGDLQVPVPIEQQVTGQITLLDGSSIDVVNGSPEMERFFQWGLERFAAAGLDPPKVGSVTFAPVPACERRTGVVSESGDGDPDLVMCTDAYEACTPSYDDCTSFSNRTRLALLHELAHVWLLANTDDARQSEFMMVTGSSTWRNPITPWSDRGVEQAAEIIAWGLLDTPITLGRIGNPPCNVLIEGFTTATGKAPINTCE